MTLGHRIVVMNKGVIQQVDTPLALYRQPVNRFVAGFIGSPAMNFIRGSVGEGSFRAGEFCLGLPIEVKAGKVTLGIRPEDLLLAETTSTQAFSVRVDVIERMGNETIGYFDLDGQPLVARLAGDVALSPGTMTALTIRDAHWHLFDAGEAGTRIASGQADHQMG